MKTGFKIAGLIYRRISSGGLCWYCADRAWTMDHIPARNIVKCLETRELAKRGIRTFIQVECCLLCNAALSDNMLLTLTTRAAYLLAYYQRKELPRTYRVKINNLEERASQDWYV